METPRPLFVSRYASVAAGLVFLEACSAPAPPPTSPNAIQSLPSSQVPSEAGHDAASASSPGASSGTTGGIATKSTGAAVARLVIEPLTLVTSTGDKLILKADGTLLKESGGKTRFLGNVTPDGELVGPGGKRLVVLGTEGQLTRSDGTELPVRLLEDGTAKSPQQSLWFNDSGNLEGDRGIGPAVHAEGPTKISRRTAMFLLILAAFPTGT